MANLTRVHESCLPELMRKRQRLIEQIRQVARDIEFSDQGDRSILAKMLDFKGVKPMSARKWHRAGAKNPSAILSKFLERHCPELLRRRSAPDTPTVDREA